MAKGDVVGIIPTSVANNGYLTIQPAAGVELAIHNLFWGGACELYWSDGSNRIKFDSDGSAGGRIGIVLEVTNTYYLEIKNVSGGAAYFGYSGRQTK